MKFTSGEGGLVLVLKRRTIYRGSFAHKGGLNLFNVRKILKRVRACV